MTAQNTTKSTWEDVGMLVDLAILAMLPKEGSRIGLKELGLPAAEVVRRIGDPEVTKSQVTGRFSSLNQLGLITSVRIFPTAAGKGWQITKAGEEVLKKHGDKLPKDSDSD